jgi:uncharacterized protein (TIGR02058 family)
MTRKRFVIEMGTGVDQHGQSATVAATRAVRDAVSRVCLIGMLELIDLKGPMIVEVLVACPHPEDVDTAEVLAVLPFGEKTISVVAGGMVVRGHASASLGDRTDEILVANAAVTVSVDTDGASLKN